MSLPLYKDPVQEEYDATYSEAKAGTGTLSWRCICASEVLKRLDEKELADVKLSWEGSTKAKLEAWEAGIPVSDDTGSSETNL